MQHVIDMMTRGVDYAGFVRAYFSEEFSVALVSAADLVERTVRERTLLPDGKQRICLRIVPRIHLPPWAAKLARGYSLGYDEETVFDPATGHAHSVVRTPGRDMLRVTADTLFTQNLEGVHTRIELVLHAKLLGFGRMIKRFAAHETEARYRIVERTLQKFVDEQRG